MGIYTVKQGDCMTSLGREYGFFWKTLWDHPENAALKQKRQNPNVLSPGDEVYIPDKRIKVENRATEKRHTFKLKNCPAKLQVRLLENDKPRANIQYTLDIDGRIINGQTDGNGWIKQAIPPDASKGKLILNSGNEIYTLNLGHLDPVDEVTGIQARIKNLGFYQGEVDGEVGILTETALRAFQKSEGLQETGQANQQTKDALKKAHES